MGAAVLAPVVRWRGRNGHAAPWRADLRRGVILGLVLFGGATLQQWGVVYTTAGKAVFAVLGGMVLLGETLPARGLVGCALILAGMILSQLEPRHRRPPVVT